jgi:hypothetical protein
MKIELQEFPTGKKIFKSTNYTVPHEQAFVAMHSGLHRSVNDLCKIVRNIKNDALSKGIEIKGYNLGNSIMRLDNTAKYLTKYLAIVSDEYRGVFSCTGSNPLVSINETIYPTSIFKATKYQRTSQYAMLGDLPVIPGLLISADIDSIIAHNMPYEGELVKSANYKKINKLITTKLAELHSRIEMQSIISSGYLDIPEDTSSWVRGKQELTEGMVEAFIKYINEESDFKEELLLARALGVIESTYQISVGKSVFTLTGKKPKFPTGLRTRLFFAAGALEVPENYQEWFD